MLNRKMLESKMKLYGDNGNTLSVYLGIARSTFSNKLTENGGEFSVCEITKMKSRYKLTPADIDEIFFDGKVS